MLNAEQIRSHLLKQGFHQVGDIVKVYRLSHPKLEHFVHIKRESRNNILIIPESYKENLKVFLQSDSIKGGVVDWSSNYKGYSTKNANNSKAGLGFDFSTFAALDEFLYIQFSLSTQREIAHNSSQDKFNNKKVENMDIPLLNHIEQPINWNNPTEREAIIKARIGQSTYRKNLLKLWKGCSVTKCSFQDVLIASHIKPWQFANDQERLDPYNGLLLTPTLDALFDKGFISFNSKGKILLHSSISPQTYRQLNIHAELQLQMLHHQHQPYLEWHRQYYSFSE